METLNCWPLLRLSSSGSLAQRAWIVPWRQVPVIDRRSVETGRGMVDADRL